MTHEIPKHQPAQRLLLLIALTVVSLSDAWTPIAIPNTNSLSSTKRDGFTSSGAPMNARCSRSSTLHMSSPTEVDEVYYTPAFTDRLGSSKEMEMTAATMKYGMGGGSGGQKITLTRWLSAKVQDFPEVSILNVHHAKSYKMKIHGILNYVLFFGCLIKNIGHLMCAPF